MKNGAGRRYRGHVLDRRTFLTMSVTAIAAAGLDCSPSAQTTGAGPESPDGAAAPSGPHPELHEASLNELAGRMAAHAIGHDPNAALGEHDEAVFVARPHQSGIGAGTAGVGHVRHLRGMTATTRGSPP